MRKLTHQLNYLPRRGEVNTMPSLTQPDMAIPLKTLLEEYTRTGFIPQSQAFYDEDNELPNPRGLDMTDMDERRALLNENKVELENRLENEKIARKKADAEKKALKAKETAEKTDNGGKSRTEPNIDV